MRLLRDANAIAYLANHSRGHQHISERLRSAGLICVTANRKHFDRITGLVVEGWPSQTPMQ